MGSHPCGEGITVECFKAYPSFAKQAFAYRMLYTLIPYEVIRFLPGGLDNPLISPETIVPTGIIFPPGWIVFPDVEFPPGWRLEDPPPPGVLKPPVFSPLLSETGGSEPLFVPPWEPGPIVGSGRLTPPIEEEVEEMETGTVLGYGGASVPDGYLLCNGAAASRITYAALFAVIGTAFGPGDGSTTFNLPDLRQRFPLGKAPSGTGSILGGTGGAIDHFHEGLSHMHTLEPGTNIYSVGDGALADITTQDAAATLTANPPFQVVNYIIKT